MPRCPDRNSGCRIVVRPDRPRPARCRRSRSPRAARAPAGPGPAPPPARRRPGCRSRRRRPWADPAPTASRAPAAARRLASALPGACRHRGGRAPPPRGPRDSHAGGREVEVKWNGLSAWSPRKPMRWWPRPSRWSVAMRPPATSSTTTRLSLVRRGWSESIITMGISARRQGGHLGIAQGRDRDDQQAVGPTPVRDLLEAGDAPGGDLDVVDDHVVGRLRQQVHGAAQARRDRGQREDRDRDRDGQALAGGEPLRRRVGTVAQLLDRPQHALAASPAVDAEEAGHHA